jgi:hypothetical protein
LALIRAVLVLSDAVVVDNVIVVNRKIHYIDKLAAVVGKSFAA